MRSYFVYIMASYRGTLYVGMTNDLPRRVAEHKLGLGSRFTSRYRVNRLVYFDETGSVESAFLREKQIKGWTRIKKVRLIELANPHWQDLSASFVDVG